MFDRERIKNVITNDRLALSSEYVHLLTTDAQKVLNDYLEIHSPISFNIELTKNGYEFTLKGIAVRIKNLHTLP